MAIEVTEVFGPRGARSSSQSFDFTRTYTRYFQAVTDDKLIGPLAVRSAIPVSIGQRYTTGTEFDNASFCVSISVSEDSSADDGCQWTATVEYGPYDAIEIQPQNPLDAQPKMSWGWAQFQVPATVDTEGKPIVNSAGDPFDPPFMKDDSRPVLQLVRNEERYDPALADDWHDAINNASWFGIDARCVKLSNISAERQFDPEIGRYYAVSYEFQLNRDEWTAKLLNVGLSALASAGSKKSKILGSDGEPVTDPQPLKADGTRKALGEKADVLEFKVYPQKDFSELGFDGFYGTLIGL